MILCMLLLLTSSFLSIGTCLNYQTRFSLFEFRKVVAGSKSSDPGTGMYFIFVIVLHDMFYTYMLILCYYAHRGVFRFR